MRRKTKTLALVEIAIVLCSMFLVATLPGVIADQEQETSKVSASEVTTASEDDFILEIYGNVNEDECIDMRDYTYTARIICWLEEETTFADANYDGRISVADMTQIGLIILGRESELTLIDTADRTVTVKKPLQRIIVGFMEILRSLKVPDKDIIVGRFGQFDPSFFPELSDLPNVGSAWEPDIEAILELNPDAVMLFPPGGPFDTTPTIDKLESAGITVLCFKCQTPEIHREEVTKLGCIFGKQDEAEKYLDWRENILNSIKEKVERIPEEAKPKVYFESYQPYLQYGEYMYIAEAGGRDIFAGVPGGPADRETVIEQDPDIIGKVLWPGGGYDLDVDDTVELEKAREEIMSRPELQMVKAVKNEKVYVITTHLLLYLPQCGCRYFVQLAYQAKWFHPTLFEDLDPEAIHQEYLIEFQGLDIDLDEKGVFVYPEEPFEVHQSGN